MLKRIRASILVIVAVFTVTLCGCITEASVTEEALEYSIVNSEQIPTELVKLIDENKTADFHLTYIADGSMYIVRGYGKQNSCGYSVVVNELTRSGEVIVCDTSLIGPGPGENVSHRQSYPYIILRTENLGLMVEFE